MTFLITGSLGTIGRPLTRHLEAGNHQVYGCDLSHTAQERDRYMRADVADFRELERVFEEAQPRVVYHLAAEFGRHNGDEYFEQVWRTNLIGTHNVLELCRRWDARLVFASTSEIYGDCEEEWLSEDLSETRPLRQPNEYALSKWANEQQVMNFERRHPHFQAIRCRFFNAYGPGETYHPYRSVIALFAHRALHGIPWTVFEGYHRTFMYVDDFIPTLAKAHLLEAGTVVNIGGSDYRSVREVSDLILQETGANSDLVTYLDFDQHNVRSKRPDNSRARDLLGHDPQVTIDQGIPLTLDWMRESMTLTHH